MDSYRLLTQSEAACMLNISVKTLQRLLDGPNSPPTFIIGRRRMIDGTLLDAWVNARRETVIEKA